MVALAILATPHTHRHLPATAPELLGEEARQATSVQRSRHGEGDAVCPTSLSPGCRLCFLQLVGCRSVGVNRSSPRAHGLMQPWNRQPDSGGSWGRGGPGNLPMTEMKGSLYRPPLMAPAPEPRLGKVKGCFRDRVGASLPAERGRGWKRRVVR